MKNIQTIIKSSCLVILGTTTIFLYSCKRYLEVDPQDRISDATVWADPDVADLFLNDIYSQLPVFHTGYRQTETWTDNCINNQTWQIPAEIIRSGNYSPASPVPLDPTWYSTSEWGWHSNFAAIRKCNVFISKVTASLNLPDDYKKGRIAEARFLRAWYYNYLYNFFGGVPIITAPQDVNQDGDSIFVARSSADETADFISKECAAASMDLPNVQSESGRITKGAALALKGSVELVAASLLNNAGKDASKWAKAAESYKRVMDLGTHSLFFSYDSLWLEENNGNAEAIFVRSTRFPRSSFDPEERYLEDAWGPANVEINGKLTTISIATCAPTQDMVDAYRMEDGKTITESPLYDPSHPYDRREKRFYKSIIYDGAQWKNTVITTRQGGNNPVDRTRTQWITISGYYVRKILDERINGLLDRPNGRKNKSNWPFIRYAEVLLGYAEAQNEVVGPDGSVYDAVDKIRLRGGLPAIRTTYGNVSQDKMREIIRTERRIELAFEGKRYYDLLRWKLAEVKLNGPIKGVDIIKGVSGQLTYNYFTIATQYFFPNKNYRFPIPQGTIDQNPKLNQNPGY